MKYFCLGVAVQIQQTKVSQKSRNLFAMAGRSSPLSGFLYELCVGFIPVILVFSDSPKTRSWGEVVTITFHKCVWHSLCTVTDWKPVHSAVKLDGGTVVPKIKAHDLAAS